MALARPQTRTIGGAFARPASARAPATIGHPAPPRAPSRSLPALERPPATAAKSMAPASESPAERQADALGARIGAALGGAPDQRPGTLRDDVRAVAESHLGVGLAGTQLKDDGAAHAATASANAHALAEGGTIAFAPGRLSLATGQGRALLGHELTHVAQQRAHGVTARQASGDCNSSGAGASDDAKYADANPGKVFDVDSSAASDEFVLWNYCVGGTQPRPEHAARLEQAAKRWTTLSATRKDLRMKIRGGDSDPANVLLARRRAMDARDFLIARGVPADKIDGIADGAQFADEPGAAGTARNRRVEISLFVPTPVAADLKPFIDVAVTNAFIGPGARSDPETFKPADNLYAIRAVGAMNARADIRATTLLEPAEVGFIQFLTGDTRIAQYNTENGDEVVGLTYDRCTAPSLPCRDTLDATSRFTGQSSGGESAGQMLSIPSAQSKAGPISMRDSPGIALPLKYPNAQTGPYAPSRFFWQMDFTVVLGVRTMGVFNPLQTASWTLAASLDVDAAGKTTRGLKPIVQYRPFKPGGPENLDIPSAMEGPTCRLLTRSMEKPPNELPCQPNEQKG